ncbi:MAG: hypothetical protein OXH66_01530 [Gemmatimonadetes bacterium]|nr:hypothetical protein [Gemmatimonadota bacterium]
MRYQMILSAALTMLLACYSPTEWEGHDVEITITSAGTAGLTIERAKVLLSGDGREFETTTNDQGVANFVFIPEGVWTATVSLLHYKGPGCSFGSRQITVPSAPITMGCL